MPRPLLKRTIDDPQPSAAEILIDILDELGDLSALMEVFYFSREPDCLAVLRWTAMLPEEERKRFAEFAKIACTGDALRVEIPHPGTLQLTLIRD